MRLRSAAIGERFDGASWHLETIPNPDGFSTDPFVGISCPSRFFCMAVGSPFELVAVAAKWTP